VNGRRIAADLKITARGYLRNPVALFFALVFPLILILLFGLIFSGGGGGPVTVYAQNFDHASPASLAFLSALNNTSAVRIQMVSTSVGNLSTYLGQNGDAVGLVIPAGFQANYSHGWPVHVTLFTNPQAASSAGIAVGAVQGVANAFNLARTCPSGQNCDIVSIANQNVGSNVYTYIDYLIPGLIGFSILTSPMFSMVDVTSSYRKEGLFRQLSLTPLTRAEWLTSRILWYILLTLLSAAIMLSIGLGIFGAHVTVSWEILPFLVLGPFFFVALGMLAGSAAKTPESAAVIGNIVTFPMMFLTGTFFPVSEFPPALQLVARILPLYYVIDGMNQVMLFGNLHAAGVDLLVIFLASVVVFVLAIGLFRWRDE
jgi:ABC-2 type transport system permease protein